MPSGLTHQERHFFTEVLTNGLGEFAYVNDLPQVFDTEIDAPDRPDTTGTAPEVAEPQRMLVAVGGGKDSIVSLELLKQAGYE